MAGAKDRRLRLSGVALAAAGILAFAAACASPPPPALEEARSAYQEAAADPVVTAKAPVALYEARKSLDGAERAWEEGDEPEALHRASLAQTRVEIARVTAQGEEARARSRELAKEREQVLLQARTAEVGSARAVAERESERARRESERAKELARTLEELQAKETDRGMVLTLGDVLFDFGEATLRPGAEVTLDRLARFLRENPERPLLVEGHTDSVGSETYNQGLSQRRAEAVARHLERRGIDPERVVARGYGEALPMVSNDTDAGRQRNRRVEIVVLDPGESAMQAARRRASDLPAVGAGPPETE